MQNSNVQRFETSRTKKVDLEDRTKTFASAVLLWLFEFGSGFVLRISDIEFDTD
jgi:hypothetical protein